MFRRLYAEDGWGLTVVASSPLAHEPLATYAVWTCTGGWKDTDVERTVELDRQMYGKYCRAVRTGDRVGKRIENVGGCTHAPLLCMHNRWETVVLCILHILMAVGKYLSVWIRKRSRLLKPAQRTKLATLLRRAKAGVVLVGKGAPHVEESLNLLAHWEEIAKLLQAGPHPKKAVADMYMLLQNLYSTRYNAKALRCKLIAQKNRLAILPTVRSNYLAWLEKYARRVLKGIEPWGLAIISGDVVESMNAILKDIFLTATPRGGGGGTSTERDARLLLQAMCRAFLHKELPQWVGRAHKAPMHIEEMAHILREFEAMGTE